MTPWTKHGLTLDRDHTWRAKPGHKIFVADRGAIRFEFPQDWLVEPGQGSIKFHDRPPPADECRLEVSLMYLPPIDWRDLPLARLVEEVVGGDERKIIGRGPVHQGQRGDLELAWTELAFIDQGERREARSRICLARRGSVQSLITMDLWLDDASRFGPVWDEVLSTLELGQAIDNPVRGPAVE